jgi:hypothetical protein
MTTEKNESEADNEVPPVARFLGRAISEWVTYSFIALIIIAVIFGSMVGSERDAQAERAMATLRSLTEAAESIVAAGGDLVCDETLLDPALLTNEYLTLTIRQAPIDEDNKSLGYGPALHVSVVEKDVSGDTWDTAKRLMELVKEEGEKAAEASEDRSGRVIDANVEPGEDDVAGLEEDKKPKNRLREVKKRSYGEDEEYLRYSILASETAICRQDA